MKYIKKFEEANKYNINKLDLKVGDYVLVEYDINPNWVHPASKATLYMNNHAGRISMITRYSNSFLLEYDNVPKDIQSYFGKTTSENVFYRDVQIDIIKYVGKTKDEVELKSETEKYNL